MRYVVSTAVLLSIWVFHDVMMCEGTQHLQRQGSKGLAGILKECCETQTLQDSITSQKTRILDAVLMDKKVSYTESLTNIHFCQVQHIQKLKLALHKQWTEHVIFKQSKFHHSL